MLANFDLFFSNKNFRCLKPGNTHFGNAAIINDQGGKSLLEKKTNALIHGILKVHKSQLNIKPTIYIISQT